MKLNTFGKVILLVIFLLVPIILLYGYSYQVSVGVVRQTMEDGNRNRLAFFTSQLDVMVDQLMKHSLAAGRDYSIREYIDGRSTSDPNVQLQRQSRIVDMLNMQTSTSPWSNQIIFYLTDSKEIISTDYSARFDEKDLQNPELRKWSYHNSMTFGLKQMMFSRIEESYIPNLFIEVRFTEANLRNMLSQLKQGADREPFLYHEGEEPIVSYTADRTLIGAMTEQLAGKDLGYSGRLNVSLRNQKYVVNYIRSESLGWYLVDLVPLQSTFAPINKSRNLFYVSIALLLVLSILATLLLYRNVQRPIQQLIMGVRRIKEGEFWVRLKKQPNNEFDYLFGSFNEMAAQIQELIDKVYKETLRSKEARLKQLQSQINPHFLYNCLFYMKNMASLGDKESVVAMALNLGEYYRYSTRLDNTMSTMREEVKLLENYLNIQLLRSQRFYYEIDIPDTMLDLVIPRLLIQPLVENAVLHGVENNAEFGQIRIRGASASGINRIVVDDNGPGMPEERLAELQGKVAAAANEDRGDGGFGLWNINQRLIHLYGGSSGLNVSKSPLGGFRAELVWQDKTSE
ncbi:histidine kinase [Bacillus sp. 3255]|uniref:sensor histidine kinase n=1 Tax=Bacillus sp. 3255 TaxID=2817904 RepID=UPI0028628DCE|nr:histidine kinase [Bacillus sp. 3255]MDR6881352.1 two-component system sensor histidine kinase YesM [Bacillus sp. 3255]